MQHATSMSGEEEAQPSIMSFVGLEGGIWENIKNGLGTLKNSIIWLLGCLSPSYLGSKWKQFRSTPTKELFLNVFRFHWNLILLLLTFIVFVMG